MDKETKQRHGFAYFLSLSRDTLSKCSGSYKRRYDVRSRNSRSIYVYNTTVGRERRNERQADPENNMRQNGEESEQRKSLEKKKREREERRQVTKFNTHVFAVF